MSRREYVLQKLKKASRICNKSILLSLRTASNLMSMKFTTEMAFEIYCSIYSAGMDKSRIDKATVL
jgi:hypothetical protein